MKRAELRIPDYIAHILEAIGRIAQYTEVCFSAYAAATCCPQSALARPHMLHNRPDVNASGSSKVFRDWEQRSGAARGRSRSPTVRVSSQAVRR